MIEVRGPDNIPKLEFDEQTKTMASSPRQSFFTEADTLKKALDAYCLQYGSSYRKYDGSIDDIPIKDEAKFFFYSSQNTMFTENPLFGKEMLVDVHIETKEGKNICLKQNLEHQLNDGDIVIIGMPAC